MSKSLKPYMKTGIKSLNLLNITRGSGLVVGEAGSCTKGMGFDPHCLLLFHTQKKVHK